MDEDPITKLAAALLDRHSYTRDNLAAAVVAYRRLGAIDAAADRVAEQHLGPAWRQVVAATDSKD
jgi:hypothetical protein